jgi:dsRNA-specific ribonuclease
VNRLTAIENNLCHNMSDDGIKKELITTEEFINQVTPGTILFIASDRLFKTYKKQLNNIVLERFKSEYSYRCDNTIYIVKSKNLTKPAIK